MNTQTVITISLTLEELDALIQKSVKTALQANRAVETTPMQLPDKSDFAAPYWRPKTCAKALGISLTTFWAWVATGKIPAASSKPSEKISLWRKEDILAVAQ